MADLIYLPVGQRLPSPVTDHWDWQTDAACRGMDSDTFFHPPAERARDRRARINAAKRICAMCPVLQQCLAHALETQEPYGIWGGQSENERAAMLGLQSLRYPAPRKPRPRTQIVEDVIAAELDDASGFVQRPATWRDSLL